MARSKATVAGMVAAVGTGLAVTGLAAWLWGVVLVGAALYGAGPGWAWGLAFVLGGLATNKAGVALARAALRALRAHRAWLVACQAAAEQTVRGQATGPNTYQPWPTA